MSLLFFAAKPDVDKDLSRQLIIKYFPLTYSFFTKNTIKI